MISSELPEVLGMSDRIYIMNEGKIVGEVGKEKRQRRNLLMSSDCKIRKRRVKEWRRRFSFQKF